MFDLHSSAWSVIVEHNTAHNASTKDASTEQCEWVSRTGVHEVDNVSDHKTPGRIQTGCYHLPRARTHETNRIVLTEERHSRWSMRMSAQVHLTYCAFGSVDSGSAFRFRMYILNLFKMYILKIFNNIKNKIIQKAKITIYLEWKIQIYSGCKNYKLFRDIQLE